MGAVLTREQTSAPTRRSEIGRLRFALELSLGHWALLQFKNPRDQHYRLASTEGPGEMWVQFIFRAVIRSWVHSFLSLQAGFSPQTPALSFLPFQPICSQGIRAQMRSPDPHP